MSATTAIIISLLLVGASLAVVAFVNAMHVRNKQIQHQISLRRRRILELEETRLTMEPIVENLNILRVINDEIIRLLKMNMAQDPKGQYLQASVDAVELLNAEIDQNQRKQPFNRVLSSDADIARHKHYINETNKIIRSRVSQGKLDKSTADNLLRELTWTHLMVEVVTHIAQGHISHNDKNHLRATSYYKKARDLLSASPIADDRRQAIIIQINQILTGERVAIDASLMPETQYNPERKVVAGPDEKLMDMTKKNYW